MSYILAALKKADQEHFLGSVPDLATPQEVQPAEPRSFRWWWIIVALLAVNAVLVVLLLMDRGAGVATAPVTGQAAMTQTASVPDAEAVQPGQQTFASSEPAIQPVPRTSATPIGAVPVPVESPPPVLEEQSRAGGEVVVLPETAQTRNIELSYLPDEDLETSASDVTAAREEPPLQGWFDLPQAFRNNLDLPRLDVHVYSEAPQGRFIMVNLKKFREGETLPNGMVLEEILPDGMALSYQGERFRADK